MTSFVKIFGQTPIDSICLLVFFLVNSHLKHFYIFIQILEDIFYTICAKEKKSISELEAIVEIKSELAPVEVEKRTLLNEDTSDDVTVVCQSGGGGGGKKSSDRVAVNKSRWFNISASRISANIYKDVLKCRRNKQ
jgi:hypothetical protein